MRTTCLIALLIMVLLVPSDATAAPDGTERAGRLQQGARRGDDLARNEDWRDFLDRANRAFFAARMSTEAVQGKIRQANRRVAELKDARNDPEDKGGRSDITADVAFLERAHRAFTAARMSTMDVQKWLREARDGRRGLPWEAAGTGLYHSTHP